ncbi:aldehyde dehydrogenase family protein [Mycobacterium sp. M26]|uniref:aldehyde dehydrogenase family protein n=1 Tax=Mycobacterium sp. M26 TaxID=1762962 RepID=UPI00073F7643|nr:aldehyde dehydrogenase family protein [Mycobacterium sp. M26]
MTTTAPSHLGVDPSVTQLRAALDMQRAAHIAAGSPSAQERLDRIDRFMAGVLEYADDLVAALSADFGNRPALTSYFAEIVSVLPEIDVIRAGIEDWMADEELPVATMAGIPAFVQTRPKGVVGIVGPWNFPVLLVIQPAIEALAAGNRLMIKFSDIPERTAAVFAEAVNSRMRPDEVEVVRGGIDTAAAFSDLPFDHLIFTGSPSVGAIVAQAAGRNLVPVTLELGGKNPVVIADDADLALAADRISGVRLMNGGQICLCPDYVFVPAAAVEEFVSLYRESVERRFPTYVNNENVVTIVNDRNFARVVGLVEDAAAKGARVVTIAPADEAESLPDAATRRIAPTVLLDVTPDMHIATEEIFGPVIVVYPYTDLDEAIDYINSFPSPLGAYFFGSDGPQFQRFIARTTSGGVTRNDVGFHWSTPGAPAGGIGRSGMGAYHGKVGFDEFSHKRTIAANAGPAGMASLVLPPAGARETEALRGMIGAAYQTISGRIES